MDIGIEESIRRELPPDEQPLALAFVRCLQEHRLTFRKDSSSYWRNKAYYWVQWQEQCVCFIAIANPDEKENRWTVWSADMDAAWLKGDNVPPDVQETAWRSVDHCGHCGSCAGGRQKVIFGKAFHDICGCTFRIDNPHPEDLPFLKIMVELRLRELRSGGDKR